MLTIIFITQLVIIALLWFLLRKSVNLATGFASSNSDQLTGLTASGKRIEAAAAEVAQDLANVHYNADALKSLNHGEAADLATRQTEKERMARNK